MGVGIVSAYLTVELLSSKNEYISHPAKGLIQISEIGTGGQVICAVFRELGNDGRLGAPVVVKEPSFKYAPNDPDFKGVAAQLHHEKYR